MSQRDIHKVCRGAINKHRPASDQLHYRFCQKPSGSHQRDLPRAALPQFIECQPEQGGINAGQTTISADLRLMDGDGQGYHDRRQRHREPKPRARERATEYPQSHEGTQIPNQMRITPVAEVPTECAPKLRRHELQMFGHPRQHMNQHRQQSEQDGRDARASRPMDFRCSHEYQLTKLARIPCAGTTVPRQGSSTPRPLQ